MNSSIIKGRQHKFGKPRMCLCILLCSRAWSGYKPQHSFSLSTRQQRLHLTQGSASNKQWHCTFLVISMQHRATALWKAPNYPGASGDPVFSLSPLLINEVPSAVLKKQLLTGTQQRGRMKKPERHKQVIPVTEQCPLSIPLRGVHRHPNFQTCPHSWKAQSFKAVRKGKRHFLCFQGFNSGPRFWVWKMEFSSKRPKVSL